MSQPTEKRADELKIGDHIHDGRGIGPVEITHVQPHRNAHGDDRVLVVTDDAAVSWHPVDQMFALATAAEMVAAKYRAQRAAIVATIRGWADWVEQHTELPAPTSMDLHMQHSLVELGSTDQDKLAMAAKVAEVLGATVQAEAYGDGGVVRVRHKTGDRYSGGELTYVVHGFLKEAPPPAEPEPAFTGQDTTLPHYEARGWKDGDGSGGTCGVECACGVTYDGFDSLAAASDLLAKHIKEGNAKAAVLLEQPLDSIPADFGADHDPAECEDDCEDCGFEVDADAADAAHAEGIRRTEAKGLPVYADSVNGEEL